MAGKLALVALMLLAGLFVSVAGAQAAELLMFDDPGCVWCRGSGNCCTCRGQGWADRYG